jgi:hypothetical protein
MDTPSTVAMIQSSREQMGMSREFLKRRLPTPIWFRLLLYPFDTHSVRKNFKKFVQ